MDELSRLRAHLSNLPKFLRAENKTSKNKGIKNVGNSCYLSACLSVAHKRDELRNSLPDAGIRCMFAMKPYTETLLRNELVNLDVLRGKTVHRAFCELAVEDMDEKRETALNPIALKTRVGRMDTTFAAFEQQDCHEFFARLVQTIRQEVGLHAVACLVMGPHDSVCRSCTGTTHCGGREQDSVFSGHHIL